MLTPSGKAFGAAAVILLTTGGVLGYPELLALGLIFAVALGFAAIWMVFRPNISAVRDIDPVRVDEGDLARGILRLTNVGKRRSPPIVAVERITDRVITLPLPSLAKGAQHTTVYPLPTSSRGIYPVGPLTIGHSDPLRLMRVSQEYAATSKLTVLPRVHDVAPIPSGRSRDMEGPTSSSSPRGGIAFHSLREYEPGDDHRLIHAKSTARTGTLMVRHNVIPIEPRLMVALDCSWAPYDDASFEDAVRVAASLTVSTVSAGHPFELVTTGGTSVAAPSTRQLGSLLDVLAGIQRSTDDAGLVTLQRVIPDQEGMALAVVTGQPAPEGRAMVSRIRDRFQMVTVVQVGERFHRRATHLQGALVINVDSSDEFAVAWNRAVRR